MPQAQLDGWETAFRFSDDIAEEPSPETSTYDGYSDDPPRNNGRRSRRRAMQRPVMASALRPSHALRAVAFDQTEQTHDRYSQRASQTRPPSPHAMEMADGEMDDAFLNALADRLTNRLMHYLRDPEVMRDLLAQERSYSAQSPVGVAHPAMKKPLSASRQQPHMLEPRDASMTVDSETLLEDNIMLARQVKRLQAMVDERQDVINWLNAEYQGFRHIMGSLYLKV